MKKPLPPTYFLVTLIVMLLLHFLAAIRHVVSFPANLFGLVPLGLGVFLNLAADRLFSTRRTTVRPFEESTHLVEEFPFSVTRNPMYLGMTLILLGGAILLGTLGALIPVVLFALIIDRVFIQAEERMLSRTFGSLWEDYCTRVRRWI